MRIVFPFFFQSLRSFVGPAVTLPPDGNNATGRPVARGIEQARRGGWSHSQGTAEHFSSPDDSPRFADDWHILSALAAPGVPRRGPPSTSTPPSPPPPHPPHNHPLL